MSDFIGRHVWRLGQRTVTPDELYALLGQDRLLCIQKTSEKIDGMKPLLLGEFSHQIWTSKDPLVWEYVIIKSSQGPAAIWEQLLNFLKEYISIQKNTDKNSAQ